MSLGGRAFTSRVVSWLAARAKHSPLGKPRSMAKLAKESERAKQILSANMETRVAVEGLVGDFDFVQDMTREEFETECADLFDRVVKPIEEVLSEAGMAKEDIDRVEMIGGGWRIPKVQQILKTFLNRDALGMTLNSDEAMAFGAALNAAGLSTAFRLRKFGIHEVTPFGVRALIDRPKKVDETDEVTDGSTEPLSRRGPIVTEVFKRWQESPSKKVVTLRRDADFEFSVEYDDEVEMPAGAQPFIARYNVSGLADVISKYENATRPKVMLTFRLTRDGLVEVEKAEASVDQTVMVEQCKDVPIPANETNATSSNETDTDSSSTVDEVGEDANKTSTNETSSVEDDNSTSTTDSNTTKNRKTKSKKKSKVPTRRECSTKPSKKTHRSRLSLTVIDSGLVPLNKTGLRSSRAILSEMETRERSARERSELQNTLESYVYELRDKLEAEAVIAVSSAEQRENVSTSVDTAGTWLEENGWEATTEQLRSQLYTLQGVYEPIAFRVQEAEKRPDAVKKMKSMLKATRAYIDELKANRTWLTTNDTAPSLKLLNSTETWLEGKLVEQEALESHDPPAFTASDLDARAEEIHSVVTRLMRKRKPKPKPSGKVDTNSTSTNTSSTNTSDTNSSSTEEDVPPETGDSQKSGDSSSKGAESSTEGDNSESSGADEDAHIEL